MKLRPWLVASYFAVVFCAPQEPVRWCEPQSSSPLARHAVLAEPAPARALLPPGFFWRWLATAGVATLALGALMRIEPRARATPR